MFSLPKTSCKGELANRTSFLYLCRELDIEICDESTSKVERRNNAPLQLKLLSDRFTKKNSVLMSAFSKVGCRQDVSRTNP